MIGANLKAWPAQLSHGHNASDLLTATARSHHDVGVVGVVVNQPVTARGIAVPRRHQLDPQTYSRYSPAHARLHERLLSELGELLSESRSQDRHNLFRDEPVLVSGRKLGLGNRDFFHVIVDLCRVHVACGVQRKLDDPIGVGRERVESSVEVEDLQRVRRNTVRDKSDLPTARPCTLLLPRV